MTEHSFPSVEAFEGVGGEQFAAIFARQRPAILKNHVAHWPAVAAGKSSARAMAAYLSAVDSGVPATVAEAPASSGGQFFYASDMAEFNFSKRQRPLSHALEQIVGNIDRVDAPIVAVQMMPVAEHAPAFALENPSPLLPPQVPPRLWIGGRMCSQTHNDADHNIACVVHGQRRFVLFPPEQVANLYIGPFDNPPPLSLVRLEDPDFERFPKFRQALHTALQADLEPGDALFLPARWWHHVSSLSPFNVMVNYWWGGERTGMESPYNTFQLALLTIKDMPDSQKAYWRAMFETYVFGTGGADHIPPTLQGPIGQMGPQMRDRLRKDLLQAFLKG